MSKARVLASNATIKVKDPVLGLDIKIGEVDSFTANSTSSIIKSRPIGTALEQAQIKYGGYDIKFSGGKVDWELANLLHAQDVLARSIGEAPKFTIESTVKHYDGHVEVYVYNNVILFGYEVNMSTGDEIGESISGFAPERNQLGLEQVGSVAVSVVNSVIQAAINEDVNGLLSKIELF